VSRTLLFVDDDVDVREAFGDLFELAGWTVVHAGDGDEALAWLEANGPPALILLDLKMPHCDGYEFRARQLAEPRYCDVPVVVFTADVHAEGAALPSLGGAPIVRKSAPFDELAALVERLGKRSDAGAGPR
jgi:CheY-like chemotaxis protein